VRRPVGATKEEIVFIRVQIQAQLCGTPRARPAYVSIREHT
jgi:hypothetical protein